MRIAFVNPPPVSGTRYTREGRCQEKESVLGTIKPPLTLLHLASIARSAGHEVQFIDANARRLSAAETQDSLLSFKPDAVIFGTSTPTIKADMEAMGRPPGKLFALGAHVKALPSETLASYPSLSGVFLGEPEPCLPSLLERLSGKGSGPLPGFALRLEDGTVACTPGGPPIDLDSIPPPAWDLVDLRLYRLPNNGKPFAMVEISRGCPFSCTFCVVPVIRENFKIKEKSAKLVVDEIEAVKKRFGITHFYFLRDSTMKSGDKQIGQISDELIARGLRIKWMTNTRIESPDEPTLKKMKESGCWLLAAGIEVEEDPELMAVRKGLRHTEVVEGIRRIKAAKIGLLLFFIFGLEGDSAPKMRRRAEYASSLGADFANFYPLVPYPGTPVYKKFVMANQGPPDWSRCDYSNYVLSAQTALAEKEVMGSIRSAYLTFYTRPSRVAGLILSPPLAWGPAHLLSNGGKFFIRLLTS